jgi:hypothetical protein
MLRAGRRRERLSWQRSAQSNAADQIPLEATTHPRLPRYLNESQRTGLALFASTECPGNPPAAGRRNQILQNNRFLLICGAVPVNSDRDRAEHPRDVICGSPESTSVGERQCASEHSSTFLSTDQDERRKGQLVEPTHGQGRVQRQAAGE